MLKFNSTWILKTLTAYSENRDDVFHENLVIDLHLAGFQHIVLLLRMFLYHSLQAAVVP